MLAFDFYPGNTGRTVVMLHGLFGSARNFASLAESLKAEAQVFALDARNHGRSPHMATHTLDDLVHDLEEFLREQKIDQPILLGHSMGGLTAMAFALKKPEIARALIVLDIAPRSYRPGHEGEIAAQKIDVASCTTRREIDDRMAEFVPDPVVRQFLQMNLARDAEGRFYWSNNIAAIEASPERTRFPAVKGVLYGGPVLAIRGLNSDFVRDQDVTLMRQAFPRLELHDLPGAQHWLHHSHREQVTALILPFLRKL
ncbi:MAG: alpha/beta fold hydrolase [Turneriella sp.]